MGSHAQGLPATREATGRPPGLQAGWQVSPGIDPETGLRICPEPVNWGGLSGSTYTEAVSWGKFVPPEEGGRFAEVLDDATVALPLVVGAVLERIGYLKKR